MAQKLSGLIYSETNIGRMLSYVALVAVPVVVALVCVATKFSGLQATEALDHAQLGRHVAAGDGFVTSAVRPLSLKQHPAFLHQPDLYNAPAHPALLALVYRIAQPSDKATAAAGAGLWVITVWLTFAVARRWFSLPTALMAALFCACSVASVSMAVNGLPSPFMALTVLLAVWLALPNVRDERDPGRDLTGWQAGLAGAVCGVAALTNYLLVVLAVVLGVYLLYSQTRKGRALGWFVAGFLVCAAPWIIRNFWVGGTPVPRLYGYGLVVNTGEYPGDSVWRMTSGPDHPVLYLVAHPTRMLRKVVVNLAQFRSSSASVLEPVVVLLFVAGLLYETRGSRWRALLAVVGAGLVLTILAACFFEPDAGILAAWWPLIAIVAATNLRSWLQQKVKRLYVEGLPGSPSHPVRLGRLHLPVQIVRALLYAVIVVLVCFPMAFYLVLARPVDNPRYAERFGALRSAVPTNAVVMTDQPWLVAWYADRPAVWLYQSEEAFAELDRVCGPVGACYVSGLINQVPAAERGSWWYWVVSRRGVYRGLAPVTLKGVPDTLRVRTVAAMPASLQEEYDLVQAEVTQNPKSAEARMRLAAALIQADCLREAADELHQATTLDSQNAAAVIGSWQVQAMVTQPEHLLALARQVTLTRPQDSVYAPVLAEAAKIFERALTFDPNNPWLLLRAATCHAKLAHWDRAEAFCQRAAELGPRELAAPLLIGHLYLEQGLGDRALAEFQKLTVDQPDNAAAYESLGQARWQLGQLQPALESFAKAQRLRPDWAGLSLKAGSVCLQLKRYPEAVAQFDKALELVPRSISARLGKADVFRMQGDRAKMIETYEELLAIRPDQIIALNNLATLYGEDESQRKHAIELAEHALTLRPDHPNVKDTLGWLYYRAGRAEEATRLLQEAAIALVGNSTVLYHLGKSLLATGRPTEAAAAFRTALQGPLPPEIKTDAIAALAKAGG